MSLLFTTMLLTLSMGCSDKEFYAFSLEEEKDETAISFKVTDEEGKPIKDAYVVSFRELPPLHIRTGEGITDINGIVKISDKTNTNKGYATVVAQGYISKKIELSLDAGNTNEIAVQLALQNTIKIMSYNVLEGFRSNDELKKNFADWVKTYDPDIILFQELNKFTESSFSTFAKTYGHDYSVLLKTTGCPTGISSKQPISDVRRELEVTKLHHGYIYGMSYGIHLYAIHLNPYEVGDDRNKYGIARVDEMRIILEDAKKQGENAPVVIGGDFNSHNKFDSDAYGPGFTYANRDHGVTNMCKEYSFSDVYPLHNKDFKGSWPCDQISVNGTNKGARIDYIMISPAVKSKCVYSDILQTRFNDTASDHYPNYIEIEK